MSVKVRLLASESMRLNDMDEAKTVRIIVGNILPRAVNLQAGIR